MYWYIIVTSLGLCTCIIFTYSVDRVECDLVVVNECLSSSFNIFRICCTIWPEGGRGGEGEKEELINIIVHVHVMCTCTVHVSHKSTCIQLVCVCVCDYQTFIRCL